MRLFPALAATRTRNIKSIKTDAAKKSPGVLAIYTGKDLPDTVGGLPCGWLITGTDGKPMKEPKHPLLAQGKVRYVGDQVALIVADTLAAGQGRRREDRGRLRGAARGGRCARRHEGRRGDRA